MTAPVPEMTSLSIKETAFFEVLLEGCLGETNRKAGCDTASAVLCRKILKALTGQRGEPSSKTPARSVKYLTKKEQGIRLSTNSVLATRELIRQGDVQCEPGHH